GGLWISPEHESNMGIKVPEPIQASPTNATLAAILAGMTLLDTHHNVDIKTDDALTVNIISAQLRKWEEEGFVGLTNKTLLKAIAAQLRRRKGTITISMTKVDSIRTAKTLAKNSLENSIPQVDRRGDLRIQSDLVIRGAKLASLTQARAYKLIRETKDIK
ncbi:hypothetical protein C8J56DRAFT_733695, partial [Mycena floridula]